MSKKKPEVSYENGRWSVGSYSTSLPNKLINHLRKKYQAELSLEDVKALAVDVPAATAVTPPAPPNKPDADKKES